MVITLIPVDAFASETPVVENEQQKTPEQPEDVVDEVEINQTVEEAKPEAEESVKVEEPVKAETEEAAKPEAEPELTEAELLEQELFEKYGDDPGNGRLAGNVPESFYDGIAMFRARASYSHNSRFNGYTIQKGIDVSHHQGKIDWAKAKADGVEFAIIRVGYRGYQKGNIGNDQRAFENMKAANAAGIPIGVYIYSQAISEAEAIEEANYALNKVKGYKIDLPIVMDYEYYSGSNGEAGRLKDAKLSKRKATNNCLAFCRTVEAAGYDAMVYANKSFLTNQLYANEISSKYEIWLANYVTSTSYTGDYTYWQYSSTGRVDGISGNVDMNFRYVAPDPDPYKLQGTNVTLNSVTLQWKKNINADALEEVSGYELEKKNSAGKFELLADITNPEQFNYVDSGLSQGTAYTYRVRAYSLKEVEEEDVENTDDTETIDDTENTDDTDVSKPVEKVYDEYSKEMTFVTGINASAAFTGSSSTYNSVTINWRSAANVTGYQVQKYNSSKKVYESYKNVTGVSFTDTGLDSNTSYAYRILPYKTVGSTTVYGAPSAGLSVKTKMPSKGVTNTKVNIRKGASTSKKKVATVKKGTMLTITGTSGSWYKVSVTVSGKKKTGYIMKKYVKVAAAPAKAAITVKGTAFDKVKVSWKKVSGASGYVVQRYNSSKKKYETVKTITKGSTVSYTDGSRNCNTTYKYRVRAYKSYYGTKVYGSYSSAVSGKTKASVTGKAKSKTQVRKGAGTSYKSYKTVKKNTKLTITGSKGSWYRVSIKVKGKKKNAYIMKKYVKL